MAVLDIEEFWRVVYDIKRDEINQRSKHLRSLPLFSQITAHLARKLSKSCSELYFNKGQYVFSQGEKIENIYIVLEGKFDIVQKI